MMSPETFIERVSERLGGLNSDMANMREDLAELKALIVSGDEHAQRSRKQLYAAVDEVKMDVVRLSQRVDEVATSAEKGAEVAAKVERWEMQGRGILIAVGMAGASVTAAAAVFFDTIIQWLRARMGL